MAENRMFVSQDTLDLWLTEERVEVVGEVMTLTPEGQSFQLITAVHFTSEVAEGGDEKELVGRVKDLEAVEALGGEHFTGSVILDDNAYEVVDGFIGEAVASEDDAMVSGHNLAAATRAAVGDGPPSGEVDLLARFFLSGK